MNQFRIRVPPKNKNYDFNAVRFGVCSVTFYDLKWTEPVLKCQMMYCFVNVWITSPHIVQYTLAQCCLWKCESHLYDGVSSLVLALAGLWGLFSHLQVKGNELRPIDIAELWQLAGCRCFPFDTNSRTLEQSCWICFKSWPAPWARLPYRVLLLLIGNVYFLGVLALESRLAMMFVDVFNLLGRPVGKGGFQG